MVEIVTLVIDIGLGSLAYWMARTAKKDIARVWERVDALDQLYADLKSIVDEIAGRNPGVN